MMLNAKPSEMIGVVGNIDPDAYAAGTVTTGWIAAKDFQSFVAIVQAGDLGASATLDALLQQASDGSGTGAKAITGKAITQLTQAGTDSNKQVLINLTQGDLDFNNGFRFVRLSVTLGTAGADFGAVVLGLNPRYGDATSGDAATVDEAVS